MAEKLDPDMMIVNCKDKQWITRLKLRESDPLISMALFFPKRSIQSASWLPLYHDVSSKRRQSDNNFPKEGVLQSRISPLIPYQVWPRDCALLKFYTGGARDT